jgi:hypothetical protein
MKNGDTTEWHLIMGILLGECTQATRQRLGLQWQRYLAQACIGDTAFAGCGVFFGLSLPSGLRKRCRTQACSTDTLHGMPAIHGEAQCLIRRVAFHPKVIPQQAQRQALHIDLMLCAYPQPPQDRQRRAPALQGMQ